MPEHRTETPERLAGLESFLWHDFDAGPDDWRRWLRRKLPDVGDEAARGSFDDAMQAGQWRRFKLCRDPSCRASFYDASKAAAKNWCAMQTCGSRNKMRRYRARSAQNRIDRDNA